MAHFAKLDENNVVIDVIVVGNADIDNLPFPESEPVGIAFLDNLIPNCRWAQTSYNNNFRIRYAGIGANFFPTCEASQYGGFSNIKQYDYFVLNTTTLLWVPPIPYPTDGKEYVWDDEKRAWVLLRDQGTEQTTTIG
jgi:hypothetical protein